MYQIGGEMRPRGRILRDRRSSAPNWHTSRGSDPALCSVHRRRPATEPGEARQAGRSRAALAGRPAAGGSHRGDLSERTVRCAASVAAWIPTRSTSCASRAGSAISGSPMNRRGASPQRRSDAPGSAVQAMPVRVEQAQQGGFEPPGLVEPRRGDRQQDEAVEQLVGFTLYYPPDAEPRAVSRGAVPFARARLR